MKSEYSRSADIMVRGLACQGLRNVAHYELGKRCNQNHLETTDFNISQ